MIGERVLISGLCTIAARRHISIGSGSMLGEMVSIRDADHDPAHAAVNRPVRPRSLAAGVPPRVIRTEIKADPS